MDDADALRAAVVAGRDPRAALLAAGDAAFPALGGSGRNRGVGLPPPLQRASAGGDGGRDGASARGQPKSQPATPRAAPAAVELTPEELLWNVPRETIAAVREGLRVEAAAGAASPAPDADDTFALLRALQTLLPDEWATAEAFGPEGEPRLVTVSLAAGGGGRGGTPTARIIAQPDPTRGSSGSSSGSSALAHRPQAQVAPAAGSRRRQSTDAPSRYDGGEVGDFAGFERAAASRGAAESAAGDWCTEAGLSYYTDGYDGSSPQPASSSSVAASLDDDLVALLVDSGADPVEAWQWLRDADEAVARWADDADSAAVAAAAEAAERDEALARQLAEGDDAAYAAALQSQLRAEDAARAADAAARVRADGAVAAKLAAGTGGAGGGGASDVARGLLGVFRVSAAGSSGGGGSAAHTWRGGAPPSGSSAVGGYVEPPASTATAEPAPQPSAVAALAAQLGCVCGAAERGVAEAAFHSRECNQRSYVMARRRAEEVRAQQDAVRARMRAAYRGGGGGGGTIHRSAVGGVMAYYSDRLRALQRELGDAERTASHALLLAHSPGAGAYLLPRGGGGGTAPPRLAATANAAATAAVPAAPRGRSTGGGSSWHTVGARARPASAGPEPSPSGAGGGGGSLFPPLPSPTYSDGAGGGGGGRRGTTGTGGSSGGGGAPPELDLHGQHAREAVAMLESVLPLYRADGVRRLTVVTGRGSGGGDAPMKRAVGGWLRRHAAGGTAEGGAFRIRGVDELPGGGGFAVRL